MDRSVLGTGLLKISGTLCLAMGLVLSSPGESRAAAAQAEVQTRSCYVAKIEAPSVDVYSAASQGANKQGQARRGQSFEVLGRPRQGWVKILIEGKEGYIRTSGTASIVEKTMQTDRKSVV